MPRTNDIIANIHKGKGRESGIRCEGRKGSRGVDNVPAERLMDGVVGEGMEKKRRYLLLYIKESRSAQKSLDNKRRH